MDDADIRILVGDQGQGKTNTGTAYAVDDYLHNAFAVSPDGSKRYRLEAEEIYPEYTCWRPDGKRIYIPKGWRIESPIKIFANFHLYGIKSVYMELPTIMDYMNSSLFKDGWFLVDETFFIDKRNSMSLLGKVMAFFGATIRKRGLHLLIMIQYKSMAELRYRTFATQTIQCEYDKRTHYITLAIKKKGERQKQSVSYYAKQYWRYYDTNEINQIPEHVMAKARALVRTEQ